MGERWQDFRSRTWLSAIGTHYLFANAAFGAVFDVLGARAAKTEQASAK